MTKSEKRPVPRIISTNDLHGTKKENKICPIQTHYLDRTGKLANIKREGSND